MGIHDGHRERMLTKYFESGFSVFEEHEKLEIILYYSVPRRNTNELAHELLSKYHTIAQVMDAPPKELLKFKGVTKRTVQYFKLIKDTYCLYLLEKSNEKTFMTTVDEYGTYFMLYFATVSEEQMVMLSLDNRGKKLGIDVIAKGDIATVNLNTREIIVKALNRHCTEVVVCHNHPGGIALPSKGDIEATKLLKETLLNIGVRLRDHYIVTKEDYCTMRNQKDCKYLF
ncbi:MAG: JAB domain-containing protein [Acutalibacteraceae bacterium]|nr:JAB domain-containing protein [Acutalibacteraceae bacterium]